MQADESAKRHDYESDTPKPRAAADSAQQRNKRRKIASSSESASSSSESRLSEDDSGDEPWKRLPASSRSLSESWSEGDASPAVPSRMELGGLKVPELRELCEQHGLAKTGKKADLLQLLSQALHVRMPLCLRACAATKRY